MKFAYDIPGYAQGHRFSDEPDYYDATNERFYDLAGLSRFGNDVTKVNGTPVFASVGDRQRRGLFLDNQNHWEFPHACPWMGSGLIVVKMNYVTSATASFTPWLFVRGGKIQGLHFSGQTRLSIDGGSSQLSQAYNYFPNEKIAVFAWSRDQQDRRSRITQDGVTIDVSAEYAPSADNGNYIGLGGQPRCRLGNLSGTEGDTTASTTGTLHVFEQHFWKGNVLRDNPNELAAFIQSLKDYYGIN